MIQMKTYVIYYTLAYSVKADNLDDAYIESDALLDKCLKENALDWATDSEMFEDDI